MIGSLRLSVVIGIAAFAATPWCGAADLQVTVFDMSGQPISDVVVIATPENAAPAAHAAMPAKATGAIMDQINKEFVPEVVVIRTGTPVLFPNSDTVAHQVYSFSATKRFALPLYRGRPYPPVIFDQPGIVTLGCNIHDRMVGYIVVSDSPYFGQTNAQGEWTHEVPIGVYRIRIWHPRLNEQVAEQSLTANDSAAASMTFRLTKAMRPLRRSTTDQRIRDY